MSACLQKQKKEEEEAKARAEDDVMADVTSEAGGGGPHGGDHDDASGDGGGGSGAGGGGRASTDGGDLAAAATTVTIAAATSGDAEGDGGKDGSGGGAGGHGGAAKEAGPVAAISSWFKKMFGGGSGDVSKGPGLEAAPPAEGTGEDGGVASVEGVIGTDADADGDMGADGRRRPARLMLPPLQNAPELPDSPATGGNGTPSELKSGGSLKDKDPYHHLRSPSLRPPLLPPIGHSAGGAEDDEAQDEPKIPTLEELAAGGRPKGINLPAVDHRLRSDADLDEMEEMLAAADPSAVGPNGSRPRTLLKPKLPPIRRAIADGGEEEDDEGTDMMRANSRASAATPGMLPTMSLLKTLEAEADAAVKAIEEERNSPRSDGSAGSGGANRPAIEKVLKDEDSPSFKKQSRVSREGAYSLKV